MAGEAVAATSSGLAVGTLAEFDGETEVNLGDVGDLPQGLGLVLRWDGSLETSGFLGVLTIYNQVLMETPAAPLANVQIWTNDDNEPDVVWVAVSSVTR
jgi:hypothetical protein